MKPVNNSPRITLSIITHWWRAAVIVIFSAAATAQESYSPYAGQDYPTTVYWGDTHLHTRLSADAYREGNRISADESYRFARGEALTATNGMRVRLRRPLDFLVVADHAEYIGAMQGLQAADPRLLKSDVGRRMSRGWQEIAGKHTTDPKTISAARKVFAELLWDAVWSPDKRLDIDETFTRSIWHQVTAAADRANDPGRFTAFIGYEWTSMTPADQLHRVVIFRDAAEKANRVLPFSAMDGRDPEALWAYLANYESQTGGEVLAIPHNANLSNGAMFREQNYVGQPLTQSYAASRSRWEPLYEVTQTKGTSETHPFLSPTDEFADYELFLSWRPKGPTDDAERILLEGAYARSGLKRGLGLQSQLGVNPFKFGMIGSTDAHTSLSAVDENNFWGSNVAMDPAPDRLTSEPWGPWRVSSSGYAAVWAMQNTREGLFAAMKRRETYATTGPRMTVRFFGGWDYSPKDALGPDLVRIGYSKGVPMGGDLTNAPAGKAPRFLIRAVKDPEGANLDRVQMIKGWRDAQGELHERIYNVALSDERLEGTDGKAPPVGSTVDVPNATYTNTIGDPELAAVWTDPDFTSNELAFYYVRVLEIPTPRWTAYDVKFFGIKDIPSEVPMVTQERAYTSPIWYTPQSN